MRKLKGITIFTAYIVVFSITGHAQSASTSVRGTVSDPQGAVVAAATATLTNPATGYSRSTTTDDHGFYQLIQVPPGTYTLTIAKTGFAVTKKESLELLVDVPATLNISLRIQSATSEVEVVSNAVQLNTQDATIGNAFGASQIESLPFEGRDPTQILSLQPGVTFVGTNVNQDYDSRGGSVSGARSDQTNITLDGVDDNDQVKGYAFQGALRSTLDSLEEFRVTTSNANADAGRSSGAQVSLVTKSGTNRFHGSVYEYNRNNVGEANDWFNKRAEIQSGLPNIPGQLIRNTFGATAGGPIVKDRAFFFLAYEGQRTRENVQTTRVVPSNNLRQGIVSYDCTGDPQRAPAAVILHLQHPGPSGYDLCKSIAQLIPGLPLVILSARSGVGDKVVLLERGGADDYVTIPFSPMELVARLRARIRRASRGSAENVYVFEDVTVDFAKAEITRSDRKIAVTTREFEMLKFLAQNSGRVISREELLREVWGYRNGASTRTVDTHVLRLRRKLEREPSHPKHLLTIHGVGYKFVP